jgi:hypothetical protein
VTASLGIWFSGWISCPTYGSIVDDSDLESIRTEHRVTYPKLVPFVVHQRYVKRKGTKGKKKKRERKNGFHGRICPARSKIVIRRHVLKARQEDGTRVGLTVALQGETRRPDIAMSADEEVQ